MMDCVMQGGMWGGTAVLWSLLGLTLLAGLAAAVALVVIWIVRQTGESRAGANKPTASLLEILQRRLAQGEITPEQYEVIRHQIQEGAGRIGV